MKTGINLKQISLILFILISFTTFGQDVKYFTSDSLKLLIRGISNYYDFYQPIKSGSHYGPCMLIEIENTSFEKRTIIIPSGTFLVPIDSTFQKMLLTSDVEIIIGPKQNVKCTMYALCSEMHKRAPTQYSLYKIGDEASELLRNIANYVFNNNIQDINGQLLLWHYTDNFKPQDNDTLNIKFKQNIKSFDIYTKNQKISFPENLLDIQNLKQMIWLSFFVVLITLSIASFLLIKKYWKRHLHLSKISKDTCNAKLIIKAQIIGNTTQVISFLNTLQLTYSKLDIFLSQENMSPNSKIELESLKIYKVKFSSPGFWEFLGKINPLEVIRLYLKDRYERQKDKHFLEIEVEQKKVELEILKTTLIKDRIEVFKEHGLNEKEIKALVTKYVIEPLKSLNEYQNNGFIN